MMTSGTSMSDSRGGKPKHPPRKPRSSPIQGEIGEPLPKNSPAMAQRRALGRQDEPQVPAPRSELVAELRAPLREGRFVVFDIETTGGNPEKNGITEIFAVRYHGGKVLETFYSLVNPGVPIPPIVRRMTGINNAMVKEAPRIGEVMPKFFEFLGTDVLVSHNTIGDMKFLRYFSAKTCPREIDNFFLCTHLLVEKLAPEAPDKSLKGLGTHFNLPAGDLHRAEADAYLTLELFKVLTDKLLDRSISIINQAIRFQGDIESGLRLGWGVRPAALESLPIGTGVFYLYDSERRLIFLSSALSLQREVKKLSRFAQIPRQLLRLALRAHDLKIERTGNSYTAMLREAEGLEQHRVQVQPELWHHRAFPVLYIARDKDALVVNIGPVSQGTLYAFGPVVDRRLAGEFLDRVAGAFGTSVGKRGLELPSDAEPFLLALLEGTIPDDIRVLQKQRLSLFALMRPGERRRIRESVGKLKALESIAVPPSLAPLMHEAGVIAVPAPETAHWQLYTIVGGRPRSVLSVRGDWEAKLATAGLGRRILERIRKESEPSAHRPLTNVQAAKTNATLWWIYSQAGRNEGAFIPLDELEEIIKKAPDVPVEASVEDESSV